MPTRLNAFTPTDTSGRIADWVEVEALLSPVGRTSQSAMTRAITIIDEPVRDEDDEDRAPDGETDDAIVGGRAILDQTIEMLSERVYLELEYRQRTLGDRYPFAIEAVGNNWRLTQLPTGTPAQQFSRLFYVACLMVAAVKYKYLPVTKTDPLAKQMPELVQVMSYTVAADYVRGESYWMGWPRPDNTTSFRSALEKLVMRARVGALLREDPEWDSGAAKDGSVDLVAWRSFADGKAGKSVLYGQVASGLNWRDKPLPASIDPLFLGWFEYHPSKERLHSMFIPFVQHEGCKPRAGQDYFKRLHADARKDERTYGIVFDRLRIAELATDSWERLEATAWHDDVDLQGAVSRIRHWVDEMQSRFR